MTEKVPRTKIIKIAGGSHIIWFPWSNRWIELKPPAWLVYKMHCKGADPKTIIERLKGKYNLPEKEALRFMGEIIEGTRTASQPAGNLTPGVSETSGFNRQVFTLFSEHHYNINGKPVSIKYGSQFLEHYIHRPLAHLETINESSGRISFELHGLPSNADRHGTSGFDQPGSTVKQTGRKYLLRRGNRHVDSVYDDEGLLKHGLYVEISSHIYEIPHNGWMSHIHASAVTNCREAILMSSASGSGKSTLAALLQLPGGNSRKIYFMSDDFVPVDAISKKAHLFPAAPAIKKGSFPVIQPFYDPRQDADSAFMGRKNSNIRYLLPAFPEGKPYLSQIVRKILFIRHEPGIKFKMKKVPVIKALEMFHREAWVSHNPHHAQSFIDWFVTLDFYKLEYSDTSEAISAVSGLFDWDSR
jgi:hypothetical protein